MDIFSLAQTIERTRRKWESQGVHTLPPATAEEIAAFERAEGVILPDEFRAYLSAVNGMGGTKCWEADEDMISFWPLRTAQTKGVDRLALIGRLSAFSGNAAPGGAPGNLFIIGDWSVQTFFFCAEFTDAARAAAPIYVCEGEQVSRIYDSLKDLLDAYAARGLDAFWAEEAV